LSDFNKCPICGKYDWLNKHTCPPKWDAIIYNRDDEENPEHAFGISAEAAALDYAEANFVRMEYPSEMEIWVRSHEEGSTWQKFEITVESVPQFTATPR